jgi:hypothetical protein
VIEPAALQLSEEALARLKKDVRAQLSVALSSHTKREEKLAMLKDAYLARPEFAKKTFPWDGASNVVIPIVGITVDGIVARLMRAFMGTKNPVEAEIKSAPYENFEKDFRDWAELFLEKAGARDQIRTAFHDMTMDGDAFIKVAWERKTKEVHAYAGEGGGVTHTEVVHYEGPVWYAIASADVIRPEGFDSWDRIPWIAERLRFTWPELKALEAKGMYENLDAIKNSGSKDRDDPRHKATQKGMAVAGEAPVGIFDLYEIWGLFEIPADEEESEPTYAEVILTYSYEADAFVRTIYNPFFGRARHIVRIPFLAIPHQLDGLGAAEQVVPFQREASTAHNQSIDAATAAIAPIILKRASANIQSGEEIYPGKQIVVDDVDKDIKVIHFYEGGSSLPNVEQAAAFWAEKRSGISSYNMGVESGVAGSRATATGTTAIISEGNMRFWVSIDDMRAALVDLLYLTLQLEQQLRPEGTPITEDRALQLPQGDLRESFGLRLHISSEKVNRDIEVQNFQVLIQVLNEYYMRLMQAAGMILNPQFPPPMKMLSIQVMMASANVVKRFDERFDVENVDELVPMMDQALQLIQAAGGMSGPGNMAPNAGALPPSGGGVPPSGPAGMLPPPGGSVGF